MLGWHQLIEVRLSSQSKGSYEEHRRLEIEGMNYGMLGMHRSSYVFMKGIDQE